MKLSNKIIEQVVSEAAGQDVIALVKFLKNRKNISEFKIADALGEEINTVRNMLYRLLDVNLVSFTRKKDKKKGWYIYYWTFNTKRIKYLAVSLKKRRLDKLKDRLSREVGGHFYLCPQGCIRLDFEQAINFEFKCPECGSLTTQQDNDAVVANIEKEIATLETELKKP